MTEVLLKELTNSDIDWMLATGRRAEIDAGTVLVREGKALDTLHILLDGTLTVTVSQAQNNPLNRAFAAIEGGDSVREIARLSSGEVVTVSVSEDKRNPLTRAFAVLEGSETASREIARLSKGEIVGETPFIDARLPSTTVKALENSVVLAISRQLLAAKLQQDIGFASRFYRVIATLLSNRLQGMLSRLGYGRRLYSKGQPLNEAVKYEDELDSSVLDHIGTSWNKI